MNKPLFYSNETIVEGLKNKDDKIIAFLYDNWFALIENLVLKNNGKTEDVEDVFQDALVILYKKLVYEKLKLTCSVKTFFYAISKNIWLQKLYYREKMNKTMKSVQSTTLFAIDNKELEEKKYKLYEKHFLNLSDDCKRILTLFLQKTSLKDIAEQMNHSSADYTKTRKYLCKKKLMQNIINDPEYNDIKDI